MAKRSTKRQKTADKVTIFVTDTHIPFEDKRVTDIQLSVAETLAPTEIIHGGDLVDWYQISTYNKNPFERVDPDGSKNIMDDAIEAAKYLKALKETCSELVFLEGNHETRLKAFIDTHYDVFARWGTMGAATVPEIMRFDWAGVDTYIPYKPEQWESGAIADNVYWVVPGLFTAMHGYRYSENTCGLMLRDALVGGMQGHSHRIGNKSRTGLAAKYTWYEVGCGCQIRPSYKPHANWQHGFAVITQYGDKFDVQNVEINDYTCRVDGHRFNERGPM